MTKNSKPTAIGVVDSRTRRFTPHSAGNTSQALNSAAATADLLTRTRGRRFTVAARDARGVVTKLGAGNQIRRSSSAAN